MANLQDYCKNGNENSQCTSNQYFTPNPPATQLICSILTALEWSNQYNQLEVKNIQDNKHLTYLVRWVAELGISEFNWVQER